MTDCVSGGTLDPTHSLTHSRRVSKDVGDSVIACTDYMATTVDLSGIEVIDADRRFIRQARKDVELQANKMLEQGVEAQVLRC